MDTQAHPVARTSIMLRGDTIRKADAVTLHIATKAGRLMNRSEMVNMLIHREFEAINPTI